MEFPPKQPTAKGPAEWFTGEVWIDGIARGEEPSRVRVTDWGEHITDDEYNGR